MELDHVKHRAQEEHLLSTVSTHLCVCLEGVELLFCGLHVVSILKLDVTGSLSQSCTGFAWSHSELHLAWGFRHRLAPGWREACRELHLLADQTESTSP